MAYYIIKSQFCDWVLDIEGEGGDGARLITWERHGKENQIWFDDVATGTIRSKSNKKLCMTYEGEQMIVKKYEAGNANQQWMRQGRTIRSRSDQNLVVDIAKKNKELGATIWAYKYKGGENQHWKFEFVGGQAEGITSPYFQGQKRDFYLVSEMHGKVLDICEEKQEPGGRLIAYDKNPEKHYNQLWYLDNLGQIRSSLTDLCIWNAKKGDQLVTAMPSNDPRGAWWIQGGTVINRAGEVLDIAEENKENGAKVVSYDSKNQANQLWKVEYAA